MKNEQKIEECLYCGEGLMICREGAETTMRDTNCLRFRDFPISLVLFGGVITQVVCTRMIEGWCSEGAHIEAIEAIRKGGIK